MLYIYIYNNNKISYRNTLRMMTAVVATMMTDAMVRFVVTRTSIIDNDEDTIMRMI